MLNTSKSIAVLPSKSVCMRVLDHEETKNDSVASVKYETLKKNTPAKIPIKSIINSNHKKTVIVDLDEEEDDDLKK